MMTGAERRRRTPITILAICIAFAWSGCGTPADDTQAAPQAVSGNLLQQRTDLIKSLASQRGITNPLLFAAIGYAESGLAQCLSEYGSIACPGPSSADCGGGAVLAGGADGVCSNQQGGLGMFQFDNGTYSQTIALYGSGILTVSGNASQGVDVILNKVWNSTNTPFWSTWSQMLGWINGITIPSNDYEVWLDTMAIYYNGCGCSTAREAYRQAAQALLNTFGSAYWHTGGPQPVPPRPTGLSPSGSVTVSTSPVTLQWSPSAGASWYIVNTLHLSGGNWVNDAIDAQTLSPSFSIPAPFSAPYAWKTRACNSSGCSPDTDWVFFTYTPMVQPPTPTGLSPSGGIIVRSSPIILQWQASSGASRYIVNTLHWSGSTWVNDAIDAQTSGPTFSITVPFSAPYAWKARACNGSGCSPDSDWVYFTYAP